MIVQMLPGYVSDHPDTVTAIRFAENLGLKTKVEVTPGKDETITVIYLLNDKTSTTELPEHPFRQLKGVHSVERVTPAAPSLMLNGSINPHHVQVGSVKLGNDLPCQLIMGPCTVDQNIYDIVEKLVAQDVKLIRGGCWKPRSNAKAFPGFGKRAVHWLLDAAHQNGAEAAFLEVIDETHVTDVMRIHDQVGYEGTIVPWVGARTENQVLLRKLGRQYRYPVMMKNPIRMRKVTEWMNRAEFVITGERHFDEQGKLIENRSLRQGNDQILLCSRGVEQDDEASVYRFNPRHEVIDTVRKRYWCPIGVDPSHSAGTMQDDLVLRNLASALVHNPAFVVIEVYLDGQTGLCDVAQALPMSRVQEVCAMIQTHNEQYYKAQAVI